ncbi:autoinducer-2 kinase [Clostridium bowmanii]|uniref:autoinducer-2 kinase n=1 Tax=Clostridium bowmanii TaxID=132925 RepID=UPI001C0B7100|nr:autoinducer-2 kinase [Clostridium bowmanii]MBU3188374.1 autoinducer-2 kinase [Clostridium bowmanii]MCA1072763.1 autoinducer-2 kinase [Clostridium bowmanii]
MNKYLMAVDAGTGSVRALLFDLFGKQIGCVQQEWTHNEDPRWPGSMDFDWTHNWESACSCILGVIHETKIDPSEISALSTTCMREGIVMYDKDGNEIWACANVDARANDEVEELIRINPELEKEIYLESGQTFALGALPRILWVKNKMPEIYENIATIGMFNDWLIYKMTGRLAVEPSNGSTTGIFDLQKCTWDSSIANKCGIRDDIFPTVSECGTVIGNVNAKGAKDTGLAFGTPVVIGGGDSQLGCIGVGVVKPNEAAVFGGSFWQYEYNTDNGKTDPGCRVRVNCHAVPGVWQYEAIAFKPGLVMRWYRDSFCQLEKQEGELTGKDPYELMDNKAASIPVGSYGMMCAFSDVMNFISWKHASPTFTNFELNSEKFNRYTFYRAILENTAMITKGHLDLVREATGNMPESIVFAGGASKSPLWCQILSDVLGLMVRVPVVKEATGLGAAILAGYGIGIYPDISKAASELVRWDKTYNPNMANHSLYEKLYEPWRKVYAAQLELCNQNLTKNMWIAPGL